MMDCPSCSETLEETKIDNRQEWCKIHYACPECDKLFVRTITYKIQSSLVDTDELEEGT
jgi:transposase-like protein